MNQQERATVDLVINGQQAKTSLKEVQTAVISLTKDLRKMKEADDPKAFAAKTAELNKINAAYTQMNSKLRETTTSWQRFKKEMETITAGVVGGNVITEMLQQMLMFIPNTINKIMDLKDSLTDIEKAAGMTSSEVVKLNKDLGSINTTTARKELREMAVVGGQFGIAKQEMLGFVEGADVLNVALGDQFDSAQAVSEQMIKLRNIFQDIKTDNIKEDMLHIGNAINVLEAAGAATAPVMADFGSRMGGVLVPLGVGSAKVLGLSAALQELNITAERGSTAVTRIFQKMLTETDQFAKVAGVSTVRFKEMINQDIFGAFMAFVEGSKRGGASALAFASILKDSELTGAGANEVISKLAVNSELVAEKIEMAGNSIKGTDSIMSEFAKKNFELARDMKELGEIGHSITQSKFLENLFAGGVHYIVVFWNYLKQLTSFMSNNTWTITGMAYALLLLNANLVKATLSTIANTTATIANTIAQTTGSARLALAIGLARTYGFVMQVVTGKITLAAAATRIWNAVLSVNPIGLVITAVMGLIAAIQLYSKNNAEAIRIERVKVKLSKDIELLNNQVKNSQDGINKQIQIYNTLSIEERKNLQKTIKLKRQEALSRLNNLKASQMEVANNAKGLTFWQAQKTAWTNMFGGRKKAQNLVEEFTKGNISEATADFTDGINQLEDQIKGFDDQLETVNGRLNAFKNAMAINSETTDQLREKQRLLQIALDGAKIGSSDYKKIASEMAKVNNELNVGGNPGIKEPKDKKDKIQKDAEDLNKILSDARRDNIQNALSDREKEADVIKEKYDGMRVLAHGNANKLKEIAKEEGLAMVNLTAKWAEEDKKVSIEKSKEKFEALEEEQKRQQQSKIDQIDIQAATGQISEYDAEGLKLLSEEQFLMAQFMLRSAMGMKNAELEKQIADNYIRQQYRKKDATQQINEAIANIDRELVEVKKDLMMAGIGVVRSFLKEGSLLAKAALVTERIFSIARIISNVPVEISGIAAAPTTVIMPPIIREAYMAKVALSAKLRAAAGIATIGANTVKELATGGYTELAQSRNPGGLVDVPTLFNGRYIAGEKGKEWIAPNWMINNPATANILGALEALRIKGPGSVSEIARSQDQQSGYDFSRLEGLINQMIKAQLMANNKRVILNYNDLREMIEEEVFINNTLDA